MAAFNPVHARGDIQLVRQRGGIAPEAPYVLCEHISLGGVNRGGDDVPRGAQGRKGFCRRPLVLEQQCRSNVDSDDLRIGGQALRGDTLEGEQFISDEPRAGKQQHRCAHPHAHSRQLPPDREILECGHSHLPVRESLTILASRSSCEPGLSPARSAASTFISNRTRASSVVRLIIPPRSANRSMSPIVSTGASCSTSRMLCKLFFSDELMNRMSQSATSSTLLNRLTTTALPSRLRPRTTSSSAWPNG